MNFQQAQNSYPTNQQQMNDELSRSVKDCLQAANVPQEFVTEPIIEENVVEVFIPVYEKEIVEVPQVCLTCIRANHLPLDSIRG